MPMNCSPIPTLDERINDIRMRTAEIVNNDILPNEGRLWAARREGESFARAHRDRSSCAPRSRRR